MPISNSNSNSFPGLTTSNQINSYQFALTDDTPISILSENQDRKGVTIYNDLSAEVYIDVGANYFTSGSYMLALPVNELYEMPYPVFTGQIGAKSLPVTTGRLHVREFE